MTDGLEHLEADRVDSLHKTGESPACTGEPEIESAAEKFGIPELSGEYVERPRVERLLRSSLDNIGAVLIAARAGSGKTELAANIARQYHSVTWYRVEAADSEWESFSGYLFRGTRNDWSTGAARSISVFVENMLASHRSASKDPALIVLDNVHNVFDADWFAEFFSAILVARSPNTRILFLSRSKPAVPLWRLRSKQVLAVMDEKVLAFDIGETREFCSSRGIATTFAALLAAESFGRIGKIKALAEKLS